MSPGAHAQAGIPSRETAVTGTAMPKVRTNAAASARPRRNGFIARSSKAGLSAPMAAL
jgi:hypothetical protein